MIKATKNTFLFIKIFLLICAILLFTEAGFKLFSNCQLSGIKYDERLGWLFKKTYDSEIREKDSRKRDLKLSFNSRGFRDRDHSFEKDEGTKRIIFLGDSYTAGIQYSNDEIFTSLFEKRLNAIVADKIKYEVINASVPAWATDQQYIYLKEEGMRYHPDYVLLMIAPNDIRETYGKKFFYLENGNLKERGAPPIPWKARICWFLANHSCAFQGLQPLFKQDYGSFRSVFQYFTVSFPVGTEMCNDKHLFLKEIPEEIIPAMELFKAILLEINQLCMNNHCKLLIAVIPTKIEFDDNLKGGQYEPGKIAEYVKAIANENAIPFLDLFSYLKAEEQEPLKIFISEEYHLNDYGHAFVAKKLVPFFDLNQ
ncbi:MAG: SGNH/GDSL hydrolase family protein [Candidatus Dadabacteria bacterium]|nr:SGNH/GDSL hydrolase family protein [Candidatus Dadabacteria bacterium]